LSKKIKIIVEERIVERSTCFATVTKEAFAKITEEMATLREELQNLCAAVARIGVASPLVGGGLG
jgi:hypothetical protein